MPKSKTDWDAVREALMTRSRGFCEAKRSDLCTGVGTMAHHVRRRSQGGTDTPENLLWVCALCHEEIHAHPAESYLLGHLKKSWQ